MSLFSKKNLIIFLLFIGSTAINAQVALLKPDVYLTFDDLAFSDHSYNNFKVTASGGPKQVSGMVGKAIRFDGINDYLNLGTDTFFNLGFAKSRTFSFWYKVASGNTSTKSRPFFGKELANSAYTDFSVFLLDKKDGSGSHLYWATGASSDNAAYSSVLEPKPALWHHVVTVIENKKSGGKTIYVKKIFIDCKRVFLDSSSVKASTQNVNFKIGTNYNGDYFKGDMDELMMFNRALNDSEALTLCDTSNYKPVPKPVYTLTPDLYIPFDDSSYTDHSLNNHKTKVYGSPAQVKGISGKGIHFDGSNDYINLGSNSVFDIGSNNSRTFSFWYQVDSGNTSSASRPFFGKETAISSGTDFSVFLLDKRDGSGSKLYWATGKSTDNAAYSSVVEPQPSVWHHVVTTIEAKVANGSLYYVKTIFIDCKKVFKDSSSVKASVQNVDFKIGLNYNGDYFKGDMDELMIFNRALNDSEVYVLCNPTYYKPVVIKTNSTLAGQVISFSKDPLSYSSVYLCKINWMDSTLSPVYTTKTDSMGKYLFTNVVNDSSFYLIADPDTNLFKAELTTFYIKTLLISGAQEIALHNQDSVINFSTLNLFDPAGNYSVSGNVYFCKTCKTSGSGTPIKNLNLVVSDEYGRRVSYLKTDNKGNFKIDRLIPGTYYFQVNRPAADNSKAPSVVINTGSIKNLIFSYNGTVLKTESFTGIDGNGNSPSPTITMISKGDGVLSLTNPISNRLNYSIYDLTGKMILTGFLPLNKTSNISVPSGIYMFNGVFQDGSTFNSKVIVK